MRKKNTEREEPESMGFCLIESRELMLWYFIAEITVRFLTV